MNWFNGQKISFKNMLLIAVNVFSLVLFLSLIILRTKIQWRHLPTCPHVNRSPESRFCVRVRNSIQLSRETQEHTHTHTHTHCPFILWHNLFDALVRNSEIFHECAQFRKKISMEYYWYLEVAKFCIFFCNMCIEKVVPQYERAVCVCMFLCLSR